MAEADFDPVQEGKRIVRSYLGKRNAALQLRRSFSRELNPYASREDMAIKHQRIDGEDYAAEDFFSGEVERWRRDKSAQAKEVLRTIVEMLGKRSDLGFFAKRIVERLKRELNF